MCGIKQKVTNKVCERHIQMARMMAHGNEDNDRCMNEHCTDALQYGGNILAKRADTKMRVDSRVD